VDYWLSKGEYTYGFDSTMLSYFNDKYKFGVILKDGNHKLLLYKRYVELFYQYVANPGLNMQIIKPMIVPSFKEYENLKNKIPIFDDNKKSGCLDQTTKIMVKKEYRYRDFYKL
jgi:hypothetical protein